MTNSVRNKTQILHLFCSGFQVPARHEGGREAALESTFVGALSNVCFCLLFFFLFSSYAANLVLQDTVERVYVGQQFGEIPLGVYLVRGENVVLLGEVDLEREDEVPAHIAAPFPPGQVTPQDLEKLRRNEIETKQARHAADSQVLKRTHAFAEHGDEGDQY